jgi:hypothetical protein
MGTVHVVTNLNTGSNLIFVHDDAEFDGGTDSFVHEAIRGEIILNRLSLLQKQAKENGIPLEKGTSL